MKIKKLAASIILAVSVLSASVFAAPAVPEPGGSLDAPQKPAEQIENIAPNLQNVTASVRFVLSSINIDHEGLSLNDDEMRGITAGYIGREIDTGELNLVVTHITKYARAHGYPAATAYIPEQTAKAGNLLMRIVAGKYGVVRIDNQSKLRNRVAQGIIAGIHEGDTVQTDSLETALYNLRDLNGVEVVGVISPGTEEGTSDLNIKIADRKNTSFILYSENYGSRSAGRYRYGLQADWYNPFGEGGKFNAGFLLSNEKQHNFNFGYEMPVGHSATTVGIGFSRSDYELGNVFRALGAEGTANTLSIYGKTPLINTTKYAHYFTYGYNYRDITDELRRFSFSWKKHSHAVNVGFNGAVRGKGRSFSYNVVAHTGALTPDTEAADILATSSDTKGHFGKGTADLNYWHKLGKNFDAVLRLSGQKAANNLDSSEHIYLGGAKGVRAYPQGEASGDEGILGTLEFRYHTPIKGLNVGAFYDAGHVRIARSGNEGNMTLKGWGLSVMYAKAEAYFARIDYARRIGDDDMMSKDAQARNRVWFMVGKMF